MEIFEVDGERITVSCSEATGESDVELLTSGAVAEPCASPTKI